MKNRAPKVQGIALGELKEVLEHKLGRCETLEAGACIYWSRGLEFELASGKVQRAIVHQAGDKSSLRSATAPGERTFQAFNGDLDGARIGQNLRVLESKLSGPTQRLRAVPNGADPAGDAIVYEYSESGLAVELEDSTVARIHVPIAPARSLKPAKKP
ncbi:MAG: hypothetical protein H6718_06805 [Polyangiaceae bacterium]|nr:hypothetical protein [Myxococcales bacterium]MCB9585088.1 hypothetical protein [Polyangiaceae bacterium]